MAGGGPLVTWSPVPGAPAEVRDARFLRLPPGAGGPRPCGSCAKQGARRPSTGRRGEGSILEAIHDAELACELSLQPVRRYGVDAAILFSDIVVPVAAIGFGVDVQPGVGPVVDRPFSGPDDLARLRPFEPDMDTPYVLEAVRASPGRQGCR